MNKVEERVLEYTDLRLLTRILDHVSGLPSCHTKLDTPISLGRRTRLDPVPFLKL